MNIKFNLTLTICFSLLFLFVFAVPIKAIDLSVEAPESMLSIGQSFEWKVNIDTQGQSIKNQEFYFTYEKNYLQMEAFMAGDFFDQVSYAEIEAGKLYVKGESNTPKTGSGLVAIAKMKIIAQVPGSANLCAATLIQPTTSPSPTSQLLTPTSRPTQSLINTPGVNTPTSLLKSGESKKLINYSIFGGIFLIIALLIRFI